jgi:hypothetical protein
MVLFDMVAKQGSRKACPFGQSWELSDMPCLARSKTARARHPVKKIPDRQVSADDAKSEKVHHHTPKG